MHTCLFQDSLVFFKTTHGLSLVMTTKRLGSIPLIPKEHNFFSFFLKPPLELIFIFLQKTSPR